MYNENRYVLAATVKIAHAKLINRAQFDSVTWATEGFVGKYI